MKKNIRFNEENLFLQAKYNIVALFYDILDYPWELRYRKWRPLLLGDIRGDVLEAGVGTGRNLKYYHSSVNLVGIELSQIMLRKAEKRANKASCKTKFLHEDATVMKSIPSNSFDWIIATFLCCVMPDNLQTLAIEQFCRVLKPGGHFRLLEIIYSNKPALRRRQELIAPFVEKIYGSRFDRHTLDYLQKCSLLKITNTYFLKDDIYLVIEGERLG